MTLNLDEVILPIKIQGNLYRDNPHQPQVWLTFILYVDCVSLPALLVYITPFFPVTDSRDGTLLFNLIKTDPKVE